MSGLCQSACFQDSSVLYPVSALHFCHWQLTFCCVDITHLFILSLVDGHLPVFTLSCYEHLGTSSHVALLPHLLGIYLGMQLFGLHLILKFWFHFIIYLSCVYVCVNTCLSVSVEARGQVSGVVLFCYHLSFRDQIGLIDLGGKSLIVNLWAVVKSFSK